MEKKHGPSSWRELSARTGSHSMMKGRSARFSASSVSCLKREGSNPKPGGSSAYRGPGMNAPADNCPRTIRRS